MTQKKNVRFIKTGEEMTAELNRRGIDGTRLLVGDKSIEGERLTTLMDILDRLEASLQVLERRGVPLSSFIGHLKDGALPTWHVRVGGREHWCYSSKEVDEFRQQESQRLGKDLVVDDPEEGQAADAETRFVADEFHEVRGINRSLARLKADFGFWSQGLDPPPNALPAASRKCAIAWHMATRPSRSRHLRELVAEVRAIGEKGLTITRFKGLGEMDPDELWETTLDPAKRTLLQVTLVDAQTANDLFKTLMGEEVEERRNFIFEKGINVKDAIDYGA